MASLVPVFSLWLPILLSAVFVFVVSSVIHMVLPIHKSDYGRMEKEDAVMDAIRAAAVKPGEYMFPSCGSMKEMGDPAFKAKQDKGPVGVMSVMPNGPWNMGRALTHWFLFSVLISLLVGYIAGLTVAPGDAGGIVFRLTATTAILGHAFGNVSNSIWKGVSWTTTCKFVFDGVVYGLVVAATFAWLWPAA